MHSICLSFLVLFDSLNVNANGTKLLESGLCQRPSFSLCLYLALYLQILTLINNLSLELAALSSRRRSAHQGNSQTGRRADKQTARQTDTRTHAQRHRRTDSQTNKVARWRDSSPAPRCGLRAPSDTPIESVGWRASSGRALSRSLGARPRANGIAISAAPRACALAARRGASFGPESCIRAPCELGELAFCENLSLGVELGLNVHCASSSTQLRVSNWLDQLDSARRLLLSLRARVRTASSELTESRHLRRLLASGCESILDSKLHSVRAPLFPETRLGLALQPRAEPTCCRLTC